MLVPNTLKQALEPQWLSAVLGRRYPGVKVASVQPGPIVSRVSTNARFHLEFVGSVPDSLPADLCVKGYFADCPSGDTAQRVGVPEALFYRDLALESGVRTLNSIYADVDSEFRRGVVITEDVVVQGATFLDSLSPYGIDQVAESLEQLAILHGRSWNRATAMGSWLTPRLGIVMIGRGIPEIGGNFEGPIGSGVPEEVRDAERLFVSYRALAQRVAESREPECLIHGDAHVGNLYLDRTGHPYLVDWQMVQRAPWYLDVGYHIGCTLSPDDRREHETDLLAHYLGCLRREGVEPPSKKDAWSQIALGMVYGFYLWGITLKVAPPITTVMLERLGTAVLDHDAYRSLTP